MTASTVSSPALSRRAHRRTAVLLLGWFSLVTMLALNGFFVPVDSGPPLNLLLSGALVLGLFAIAWFLSPTFRVYVLDLDLRLLVLVHSLRMLGLGFVMLYLVGQLPMSFALLAGIGDALTALGAVLLVWLAIRGNGEMDRQWLMRWNSFGLLDFIVALSVGVLTRKGALLAPADGLNSDIMLQFPLVIIPAFLVQLLTLTHVIIYLQLRRNTDSGDR